MVTSVTLGVVLAFDQPHHRKLTHRPRHPDKPIFGKLLIWRVTSVTVYLVLVVLGIFQWEQVRHNDVRYLRACSVNALVTAQVAYIFCCRHLRDNLNWQGYLWGGNPWLYLAIAVTVALQMLQTYVNAVSSVFETAPIDGISWAKIIFLAVVVFLAVEMEKALNKVRWRLRGCWAAALTAGGVDEEMAADVVEIEREGREHREDDEDPLD
jgi:cation-transporting ATPase F